MAPLYALFWMSFVFYCLAAVCITFLPVKERFQQVAAAIRYSDLLRYPAYMVLLGLFSVVTMVIFLPWTFTALYAKDFGGVDNLWIGILMAGLYLGSVLLGLSLGQMRRSLGSVAIVLSFEAVYVLSAILLFSSRALPMLVVAFFLRGAFWSFRHIMTAVIGEVLPDAAMAKGYGLFALVTGAAAALAYPVGGWMYGMQAGIPFWSSAVLMGGAMVATVLVRAYFHANYLRPVHVVVRDDERALPKAA